MTTARTQPEGEIWQYGFEVPADIPHGARGTASGPSTTTNLRRRNAYGLTGEFYEGTAENGLTSLGAAQSFFQTYLQAQLSPDQGMPETISELLASKLRTLADPMTTMSVPGVIPKPFPDKTDFVISRELQYDALRFVSWPDGWDGESGERIHCDVAFRALEIVSRLKPEFDEPFFAPAPSGALLLQWKFSDGNVIDIFVESADSFPECAVLTGDDSVDEVEISSLSDLRSLLRDLESASAPG